MGTTHQSIIVNAPADKVWSTIKNFHDFSWAPNVIISCKPVGDVSGDTAGAKRVLNDAFKETLIGVDDANRTMTYSIDDGPPPVSKDDVQNYVGNIRLTAATIDNATLVEWSSSWEGKENGCADFCQNIYVALLGDLKKSLS